jgi:hypothetical protein
MPSDISGTTILDEDPSSGHRVMRFARGPVFCNLVMAEEIAVVRESTGAGPSRPTTCGR